MNGWDRAKTLTEESAGGRFVRLQQDGEKMLVKLCGDVLGEKKHWLGEEYAACTDAGCPHCAKGVRVSARVKINVFLPAERAMKIWECSGKTFADVLVVREKYGTDKWLFEIKRKGAPKSTKTTYSILPERELTADERKLAESLPLHDLTVDDDDEDDDAPAAAPARDPNARVTAQVAAEFRERLRALSLPADKKKAAYYAILGAFGCERMDDLLAADEDKARGLVERAERGEPIAPPPPPKDEFADFP